MAIVINGSGTVTGLAVGGLPDGTVDEGTLATDSVTTTKIPAALENTFVSGRKNMIINGAIQVSQRGSYTTAVSVANTTYYQDRWTSIMNNGVAATIQTKSTDQPNGQTGNCIRVITSAGSSAAECCVDQRIENPQWLAGRTLTFSVWMKSNTNKAGITHYNNQDTFVAPTNHTGGGAWEKLTLTHTVNSTAPTDFRLRLGMSQSGNTVVGVGDYFEITEAQVELGSVATDFEHRSYGEELSLCQRYYQQFGQTSVEQPVGAGVMHSTTKVLAFFPYLKEMRTTPTISTSGAGFIRAYKNGAAGELTTASGTLDGITTTSARLNVGGFSTSTAGGGVYLQLMSSHKIYLDAEL